MTRRQFLAAFGSAALARPIAAVAQPAGVPRIGVLMGSSPSVEATSRGAFRGALEKLGYIDGQTIQIEERYAEGRADQLGSLAREVVALAPSVIACVWPAGNDRLAGGHSHDPDGVHAGQRSRRARSCRDARPAELTTSFAEIQESSTEALLVQNDPMSNGTERPRILDFALAHRLPTVFESSFAVARGALLSYGADLVENARLAAGYVAKILKGAKPADLPVQQPT